MDSNVYVILSEYPISDDKSIELNAYLSEISSNPYRHYTDNGEPYQKPYIQFNNLVWFVVSSEDIEEIQLTLEKLFNHPSIIVLEIDRVSDGLRQYPYVAREWLNFHLDGMHP